MAWLVRPALVLAVVLGSSATSDAYIGPGAGFALVSSMSGNPFTR